MRLLYQGGSAVNLKQLEYFVTLAETEHYRKAAESLYITEPSLNRAVRDLEKEMGVPLFEKGVATFFSRSTGKCFTRMSPNLLKNCAAACRS